MSNATSVIEIFVMGKTVRFVTGSDDISANNIVPKTVHKYTLQDLDHKSRNESWKYNNENNSDLNHSEKDVYTSNVSTNLTLELDSVEKLKPYTWKYKRIKRAQQITRLNMGDHRRIKHDVSENKTDSWRKLLLNKLRDQHKDKYTLWKNKGNVITENNKELSNNELSNTRENYQARCRKNYDLVHNKSTNDNTDRYKPIWKGDVELSDKHKPNCNSCKNEDSPPYCEKLKHGIENHNLSFKDKLEPKNECRKKYYFSDNFEEKNELSTSNGRNGGGNTLRFKDKLKPSAGQGISKEYTKDKYDSITNDQYKFSHDISSNVVEKKIKPTGKERITPNNEYKYKPFIEKKSVLHESKYEILNDKSDEDVSKVKDTNENYSKVQKEKSSNDWKTHNNELSETKTDDSDEWKNEYELPNNKLNQHAKGEFKLSWKGKYHTVKELKDTSIQCKDGGYTDEDFKNFNDNPSWGFKDKQNSCKTYKTHPEKNISARRRILQNFSTDDNFEDDRNKSHKGKCTQFADVESVKNNIKTLKEEFKENLARCVSKENALEIQTNDTEYEDSEYSDCQSNNTQDEFKDQDDTFSCNGDSLQLQLASSKGRKLCYRVRRINPSKKSIERENTKCNENTKSVNCPAQYRVWFRSRSPSNSSAYHSSENSKPIKSILRGTSSYLSVTSYSTGFDYRRQNSIGTEDTKSRRSSWRSQIKNWTKSRFGLKTKILNDYESDVTDDVPNLRTAQLRFGKVGVPHTTVREKVLKRPCKVDGQYKQQKSCPDVILQQSHISHNHVFETRGKRYKHTSYTNLLPPMNEVFNKQEEKSGKKKFKITIKKKPKFTDRHACHCELQTIWKHRRSAKFPRSVSIRSNRQDQKTSRHPLKRGQYTLPTQAKQSSTHSKRQVRMKQPVISPQLRRNSKPTNLNQNQAETHPRKSPVNKNKVLSASPLTGQKQPELLAKHCSLQDKNFMLQVNKNTLDTENSRNDYFKNEKDLDYQQHYGAGENGLQHSPLQTFPPLHKTIATPLDNSTQPYNETPPQSAENEQQNQSFPQGTQDCQVKISFPGSVKRVHFEDSLNTCFYYNVPSENSSDTTSFQNENFLNHASYLSPKLVEGVQSSQESQDEEQLNQTPQKIFKPAENIIFKSIANENTNLSQMNWTCNNDNTGETSCTENRTTPFVQGLPEANISNTRLANIFTPCFDHASRANGEEQIAYEEPVKDYNIQWQTTDENTKSKPFQVESANKIQSEIKYAGTEMRALLPIDTALNYPSKTPSYSLYQDKVQYRKKTPPSRGQGILRNSFVHDGIREYTSKEVKHTSNTSRTKGGNN
ncbi:hypothetical protein WDU94_015146 [Cyamophila willieti]